MKMILFTMEIIDADGSKYKIKINNDIEYSLIEFDPFKKELHFISDNNLADYLKINEYQLRKMFHNKRIDTYYMGFKVKFVLTDGKDVSAFNGSQAELEAAIKAIELLKEIEKIRIITDSQYVRKGLTEWLPIWKLNNFKTPVYVYL